MEFQDGRAADNMRISAGKAESSTECQRWEINSCHSLEITEENK
jgi:hypothetical protein